jgi:hypothetical protein
MLYYKDYRFRNEKIDINKPFKPHEKEYGICDTDDNTVEYKTESELLEILPIIGWTAIKGVVYSGSYLVFHQTNPIIEYIKGVSNNVEFSLSINGVVHKYIKRDEMMGSKGFIVSENGKSQKLPNTSLIMHQNEITIV